MIHKSVHFLSSNVISEPNGRYILVSGQLYNTPVVNVYGPNWDKEAFFQSLNYLICPQINSFWEEILTVVLILSLIT